MPGIPELRQAVAQLYNHLFRQGKASQYTERNVCICGGGRASLTRAVAALGADREAAVEALGRFAGVGRRFERLGAAREVDFVDDYAHHPTELAAALAAARQAFPGRRLVAVFQPHLYSRTALHAEAMGAAVAAADLAVVADVYGARELPVPGVSGQMVADAAGRHGATVVYQPVRSLLGATVEEALCPGDVVVTLGAGDVTRVGRDLLARLRP